MTRPRCRAFAAPGQPRSCDPRASTQPLCTRSSHVPTPRRSRPGLPKPEHPTCLPPRDRFRRQVVAPRANPKATSGSPGSLERSWRRRIGCARIRAAGLHQRAGSGRQRLHRHRAGSARLRWARKRRPAQLRSRRLSRSHSSGHRSPRGRRLCHVSDHADEVAGTISFVPRDVDAPAIASTSERVEGRGWRAVNDQARAPRCRRPASRGRRNRLPDERPRRPRRGGNATRLAWSRRRALGPVWSPCA
jgi:hypothetical protein